MRRVLRSLAYAVAALLGLVIAVPLMSAMPAQADDEILDPPRQFSEALQNAPGNADKRPVTAKFDEVDAVAALEGIGTALAEVGDGGTYVWHRRDGVLSGMAQPSASFKDLLGHPCRHLTVMLNTYGRSSRIDGIACRTAHGRWELAG